MLEMYCDGASRGNPGSASIGVCILKDGEEVFTISRTIGVTTNNVAEWTALISGLEACATMNEDGITVYLDSELVVKQFNGAYKTKHPDLIPLKAKAINLGGKFKSLSVRHVRREKNKRADELANEALDSMN